MENEKQSWEQLRDRVKHLSDTQEHATAYEHRLRAMEHEVSNLKSHHAVTTEQLRASFQTVAVALERLVTRSEFDPVRLIVYGLCCSIVAGIALAIFSRVLYK